MSKRVEKQEGHTASSEKVYLSPPWSITRRNSNSDGSSPNESLQGNRFLSCVINALLAEKVPNFGTPYSIFDCFETTLN